MDKWDYYYKIAEKYYIEHGNLAVRCNYVTDDGCDLGAWLLKQRVIYKNLSDKRKELLANIGFIVNLREYNWQRNYCLAKDYYLKHGDIEVPMDYKVTIDGEEILLGVWIQNQRRAYKGVGTGKISKEHIKLLNKIGMIWYIKGSNASIRHSWLNYYKILKKYYIKNGNIACRVDYRETIDNETYYLGKWLKNQKDYYKKGSLSKEKIELLELIGICWNNNEDKLSPDWLYMYSLAKKFYLENGHLYINSKYIIFDNNRIITLGTWIVSQRKKRRKSLLSEKKIDLLNEIGMFWHEDLHSNYEDTVSSIWLLNYGLLKKYLEENDHKPLPFAYTVYHTGKNYNLYSWLLTQNYLFKLGKLCNKKIQLLQNIGIVFEENKEEKSLSLKKD